jgi:hypothetical protein
MNFDDYLRDKAANYRELVECADDILSGQELLELAAVCEEVANTMEDSMTAGRSASGLVFLPASFKQPANAHRRDADACQNAPTARSEI